MTSTYKEELQQKQSSLKQMLSKGFQQKLQRMNTSEMKSVVQENQSVSSFNNVSLSSQSSTYAAQNNKSMNNQIQQIIREEEFTKSNQDNQQQPIPTQMPLTINLGNYNNSNEQYKQENEIKNDKNSTQFIQFQENPHNKQNFFLDLHHQTKGQNNGIQNKTLSKNENSTSLNSLMGHYPVQRIETKNQFGVGNQYQSNQNFENVREAHSPTPSFTSPQAAQKSSVANVGATINNHPIFWNDSDAQNTDHMPGSISTNMTSPVYNYGKRNTEMISVDAQSTSCLENKYITGAQIAMHTHTNSNSQSGINNSGVLVQNSLNPFTLNSRDLITPKNSNYSLVFNSREFSNERKMSNSSASTSQIATIPFQQDINCGCAIAKKVSSGEIFNYSNSNMAASGQQLGGSNSSSIYTIKKRESSKNMPQRYLERLKLFNQMCSEGKSTGDDIAPKQLQRNCSSSNMRPCLKVDVGFGREEVTIKEGLNQTTLGFQSEMNFSANYCEQSNIIKPNFPISSMSSFLSPLNVSQNIIANSQNVSSNNSFVIPPISNGLKKAVNDEKEKTNSLKSLKSPSLSNNYLSRYSNQNTLLNFEAGNQNIGYADFQSPDANSKNLTSHKDFEFNNEKTQQVHENFFGTFNINGQQVNNLQQFGQQIQSQDRNNKDLIEDTISGTSSIFYNNSEEQGHGYTQNGREAKGESNNSPNYLVKDPQSTFTSEACPSAFELLNNNNDFRTNNSNLNNNIVTNKESWVNNIKLGDYLQRPIQTVSSVKGSLGEENFRNALTYNQQVYNMTSPLAQNAQFQQMTAPGAVMITQTTNPFNPCLTTQNNYIKTNSTARNDILDIEQRFQATGSTNNSKFFQGDDRAGDYEDEDSSSRNERSKERSKFQAELEVQQKLEDSFGYSPPRDERINTDNMSTPTPIRELQSPMMKYYNNNNQYCFPIMPVQNIKQDHQDDFGRLQTEPQKLGQNDIYSQNLSGQGTYNKFNQEYPSKDDLHVKHLSINTNSKKKLARYIPPLKLNQNLNYVQESVKQFGNSADFTSGEMQIPAVYGLQQTQAENGNSNQKYNNHFQQSHGQQFYLSDSGNQSYSNYLNYSMNSSNNKMDSHDQEDENSASKIRKSKYEMELTPFDGSGVKNSIICGSNLQGNNIHSNNPSQINIENNNNYTDMSFSQLQDELDNPKQIETLYPGGIVAQEQYLTTEMLGVEMIESQKKRIEMESNVKALQNRIGQLMREEEFLKKQIDLISHQQQSIYEVKKKHTSDQVLLMELKKRQDEQRHAMSQQIKENRKETQFALKQSMNSIIRSKQQKARNVKFFSMIGRNQIDQVMGDQMQKKLEKYHQIKERETHSINQKNLLQKYTREYNKSTFLVQIQNEKLTADSLNNQLKHLEMKELDLIQSLENTYNQNQELLETSIYTNSKLQ